MHAWAQRSKTLQRFRRRDLPARGCSAGRPRWLECARCRAVRVRRARGDTGAKAHGVHRGSRGVHCVSRLLREGVAGVCQGQRVARRLADGQRARLKLAGRWRCVLRGAGDGDGSERVDRALCGAERRMGRRALRLAGERRVALVVVVVAVVAGASASADVACGGERAGALAAAVHELFAVVVGVGAEFCGHTAEPVRTRRGRPPGAGGVGEAVAAGGAADARGGASVGGRRGGGIVAPRRVSVPLCCLRGGRPAGRLASVATDGHQPDRPVRRRLERGHPAAGVHGEMAHRRVGTRARGRRLYGAAAKRRCALWRFRCPRTAGAHCALCEGLQLALAGVRAGHGGGARWRCGAQEARHLDAVGSTARIADRCGRPLAGGVTPLGVDCGMGRRVGGVSAAALQPVCAHRRASAAGPGKSGGWRGAASRAGQGVSRVQRALPEPAGGSVSGNAGCHRGGWMNDGHTVMHAALEQAWNSLFRVSWRGRCEGCATRLGRDDDNLRGVAGPLIRVTGQRQRQILAASGARTINGHTAPTSIDLVAKRGRSVSHHVRLKSRTGDTHCATASAPRWSSHPTSPHFAIEELAVHDTRKAQHRQPAVVDLTVLHRLVVRQVERIEAQLCGLAALPGHVRVGELAAVRQDLRQSDGDQDLNHRARVHKVVVCLRGQLGRALEKRKLIEFGHEKVRARQHSHPAVLRLALQHPVGLAIVGEAQRVKAAVAGHVRLQVRRLAQERQRRRLLHSQPGHGSRAPRTHRARTTRHGRARLERHARNECTREHGRDWWEASRERTAFGSVGVTRQGQPTLQEQGKRTPVRRSERTGARAHDAQGDMRQAWTMLYLGGESLSCGCGRGTHGGSGALHADRAADGGDASV
eukprot:ctg_174.g122